MEKRILSYVENITTLTVVGNLNEEEYAKSWLALSNNKRDNKEFIKLQNFSGSNQIVAVIDVTKEKDIERIKTHYVEFFEAWGVEITKTLVESAVKYTVEEIDLEEIKPAYLELK